MRRVIILACLDCIFTLSTIKLLCFRCLILSYNNACIRIGDILYRYLNASELERLGDEDGA